MGHYKKIENEEYYLEFGIRKKDNSNEYRVVDKEKLLKAYNRACENRDFEINKFWTRAAYFWGFIVLTFTAYFSLIKSENVNEIAFLDDLGLLIISVGLILSLAWTFVIKGSKRWQENWEQHIDMLEDFISGPIYKTIHKSENFYSVSKINEIISYLMISVWSVIFLYHIIFHDYILEFNKDYFSASYSILLSVALIIIFGSTIILGYGRSKIKAEKGINRRIN